ncbi:MAG TPA: BamA/TamA family outer membrane protein [Isosphaeraceae bacterium]|jgi:outer membrane protein insertion porin family|nr:BamA/TamA family outer membrane protein [Isosphaeraceae bacterium]
MATVGRAESGSSARIRRIARALIVSAMAALALAATGDLPEGALITKVQIEGNVSIPSDQIRAKIISRAGRPLERSRIEADIKSLNNTKWFSDVKSFYEPDPTAKGYILTFRVFEMPVLTYVEFRGRSKIALKEIQDSTGLKVGARADVMRTRLAVKQIERLYEEKGYEYASVRLLEGGNVGETRVVMSIFEGPKSKVGGVAFEGNTYATDAVLKTKISSKRPILGVVGGKYHADTVDEDVRKLITYYQGQGFFEVQVVPVTRSGSALGDQQLTFVIWEGTQFKVRNIQFEGNKRLTTDQLKEGLLLHSDKPFSDALREADLMNLKNKYFSQGYIDAKFNPYPRYLEEPGLIDLVYQVEEGEAYMLGELIVRGNARTRDQVVRREAVMAGLMPGEKLDMHRIDLFKKRLTNLHYFQMSNDMGGKTLEVKIVNRRPHDKPYGSLAIPDLNSGIGLTRLQDPGPEIPAQPPAANEPLAPGAGPAGVMPFGAGGGGAAAPPVERELPPISLPAAPPELDNTAPPLPPIPPGQSARGLSTPPVGAGEPPGMMPSLPGGNMTNPGPDRNDPFLGRNYADIVAQVDEAPTGNFMFGVGASSYGGLMGNVQIVERNFDIWNPPRSWSDVTSGQAFRGGGQYFSIQASPGTQINSLRVQFTNPYVFALPIGFTTQGYVFQRLYPNWTETRGGGRFSLGRQFGTQTYADVAFRIEDVSFFGYRTPAPAAYLAASGHTTLASLRPSLRFDNRNDPFAPNKGQYVEFAFEQGWGNFTFPKFTVEGRQYVTLGRRPDGTGKRILKFRGYYGISGRDTPVYERFFAGDFGSMRGFSYRGVGPHILGVNVGGIMTALGSIEYQFPLMANDQLHQVIFTDFGTVESSYRFTTFRAAIGTGIRINIPQFGPYPLAFDIAFPLVKEDGDRTRIFAFFMGVF